MENILVYILAIDKNGWLEFNAVKGKMICVDASPDYRWAVWKGEAHLREYLKRTGREVMVPHP